MSVVLYLTGYFRGTMPKKIRLTKEYLRRFQCLLESTCSSKILPRPFRCRASRVALLLLRYRRPLLVLLHMVLVILANYLAFWLRFDGIFPKSQLELFAQMLPWLVAVRGLTFFPFRLYEGIWRYTSTWDLRNIIAGVFTSTVAFYILSHWIFGVKEYPRSILIIDTGLLIFFMGGIRLTGRVYRRMGQVKREKRVLIYGVGDA